MYNAEEQTCLLDEDPKLSTASKATTQLKTTCKEILVVLREEFRFKNFGFSFPRDRVFFTSQWRCPPLLFVIYRILLAGYTVTNIILNLVYYPKNNPERPWPLWKTNWTNMIVTIHQLLSAVIAALYYREACRHLSDNQQLSVKRDDDEDDDELLGVYTRKTRWYFQLDWLFYCVDVPSSIIMFISLAPNLQMQASVAYTVKDFNNHIMCGIIAVIEMFINAIPVRLLHVFYSFLFFAIYLLFSFFYYQLDPYVNILYPNSIDWRCPNDTMIAFLKSGIVEPIIIQTILFIFYRIRLFMFEKCCKQ